MSHEIKITDINLIYSEVDKYKKEKYSFFSKTAKSNVKIGYGPNKVLYIFM